MQRLARDQVRHERRVGRRRLERDGLGAQQIHQPGWHRHLTPA
ncbi:hypothetical protein [Burkholderia gladioli]|nr:hypothetical protein [Burkholderia gladioli]